MLDTLYRLQAIKRIVGNAPGKSSGNKNKRTLACTLTTPEQDDRKATVLRSLKKQIVQKKELPDGFSYRFKGTDSLIDKLCTFIKTERHCCSFFDFGLQIAGDGSTTWFTITGPEGAKEFIKTELGL